MGIFLNCPLPYFLRQSLMEPEVHSFSLTGWPVSSRELPIAASPSAGAEAYTSAYVSSFYRMQGIHTQNQMLMTQALYQLNYLPGLWFFSLSGMSFFLLCFNNDGGRSCNIPTLQIHSLPCPWKGKHVLSRIAHDLLCER